MVMGGRTAGFGDHVRLLLAGVVSFAALMAVVWGIGKLDRPAWWLWAAAAVVGVPIATTIFAAESAPDRRRTPANPFLIAAFVAGVLVGAAAAAIIVWLPNRDQINEIQHPLFLALFIGPMLLAQFVVNRVQTHLNRRKGLAD